jgi:hypothetical protein
LIAIQVANRLFGIKIAPRGSQPLTDPIKEGIVLNIVVEFSFEDELERIHKMSVSFFGINYHEAYEQAMEFSTRQCEINEWCLLGAEVTFVLDTRN